MLPYLASYWAWQEELFEHPVNTIAIVAFGMDSFPKIVLFHAFSKYLFENIRIQHMIKTLFSTNITT